MKKKIALDLDGVVFDSENLYRVYTEIYDTDVKKRDNIIDNSQRIFQKRNSWSTLEFKNFYDEYASMILESANIMTGADIVLKKLKERFEFIVLTSRSDAEMEIARKRLKDIGLDNIEIFNNEHNKVDRLISLDVDYIIDDDESICCNAADNGICALYFKNNASNRIEHNEKVINVNNWGEIYKFLMLKDSEK